MNYSRELLIAGGVKNDGLSPKTVNSIISVLKSIFKYAGREKNYVVADIRDTTVRQPQKPMRILSRMEQKRLSEYLYDNLNPCYLGILICLYTGLRIEEICALKWKNIHLNEQYLYICQSMQRVPKNDGGKKKTEIMIMPPKSDCAVRKIPVPGDLLQILRTSQKSTEAFLLTGSNFPHRLVC